MNRTRRNEEDAARLRLSLASAGVTLYADAPAPRAPLAPEVYRDLLRALLLSGDVRFLVAIPCLLAANDGPCAAAAVVGAGEGLDVGDRERLGLLHRLARAFVASRAPDLRRYLGRGPRLDPVPLEPAHLRDPSEDCGEAFVREAAEIEEEAGIPRISADAERAFDTWLGILAAEGVRHEPA